MEIPVKGSLAHLSKLCTPLGGITAKSSIPALTQHACFPPESVHHPGAVIESACIHGWTSQVLFGPMKQAER